MFPIMIQQEGRGFLRGHIGGLYHAHSQGRVFFPQFQFPKDHKQTSLQKTDL